jgi:hypothetical protein
MAQLIDTTVLVKGYMWGVLQNKFRFETTETGTETSFGTIRNKSFFRLFRFYTKTDIFDVSIEPKQTETSRNSLVWSIFWYFFRKFRVIPVFSVCFVLFRNSLFRLFRIFWYFYENLGLFSFVLKQLCLFRLFRYRFKTPKQTETNRNFWF